MQTPRRYAPMGGSFAPVRVAAFKWNGWQASAVYAATAEIRPHTGETATVAEFRIEDEIRAVDLRNPRLIASPFMLSDADAIGQLLSDLPLLERLGAELTRPVLPSSAAIDYIPSQYLCEFIRTRGFDGVVYSSSVSDGINLALFDVQRAKAHKVMQTKITRVSVEIDQLL